jgi:hypothetical protein
MKWQGVEESTWEPCEIIAADVNELVKKYLRKAKLNTAWNPQVQSLLESKIKRV